MSDQIDRHENIREQAEEDRKTRDRGKDRMNTSTSPHVDDADHADRMEGSYAPGVDPIGPGSARAPEDDGDEDAGPSKERGGSKDS